jgi:dsRNA-specific ribonuclease
MDLMRASVVCNQALAGVALHFKLYSYLDHCSSALAADLQNDVARYERQLKDEQKRAVVEAELKQRQQQLAAVSGVSAENHPHSLSVTGDMFAPFVQTHSKVLSDLVEALIGAVHVDNGFDIECTYRHAVWPLLGSVLRQTTPERAVGHPISVIDAWAGKRSCKGIKYEFKYKLLLPFICVSARLLVQFCTFCIVFA